MAGPHLALFLILGGALAVGYVGHRVFRRFHVSDVVFLLLAGILAGPVLGLVDPSILAPAMPFLSALALVVVLFDGGLELAWNDIRQHAGRGLAMAMAVWTLTALGVGFVAYAALGFTPILAALFGICVAATGMLVVIPLLAHVEAPPVARVMLTLETSLGDLLSAVVVTTISGILVLGATPADGALLLSKKFLVGASVGLLAGIVWARLLHVIAPTNHGYSVTLAALLLAYAAAETLGGSGFLRALAFGLFLGNAHALMRAGGLRALAPLPNVARIHQSEMIFLLRAVYFVFLGMSIRRSILTPQFVMAAVAFLVAIVAARALGVWLTTRAKTDDERRARTLLVAMMPRGLATAVIAAIPVTMGVPGTADFAAYTFAIIIAADLATSAGLVLYRRAHRDAPAPAAVVA